MCSSDLEDYDARARGEELGEWSTRNRYVDEADDDSFDDFDEIGRASCRERVFRMV